MESLPTGAAALGQTAEGPAPAGRLRRITPVVAMMAVSACAGAPSTAPVENDTDLRVDAASPTLQYVAPQQPLEAPPTVTVTDAAGHPLRARRVRYRVVSDSAALADTEVRTDSLGRAQVPRWLLREAREYRVEARVGAGANPSVVFRVVALPSALFGGEVAARCPLFAPSLPRFANVERTARRLRTGSPVTIVAIGSSSTAGTGASSVEAAFPSQMRAMLTRAFPAPVTMVNAGVPGHTALDLEARLDRDVLAHRPHLVILQTGTNDALRAVPLDTVRASTARTIARLQAAGAEVVVLDSQRFPGAGETAAYQQYLTAVSDVAAQAGVSTARRFAWMSMALERGRYDFAQLITYDGLHQTDQAHECTAFLLATGLAAAAVGGR